MSNIVYIARQPILDKNNQIFAYELLYRDSEFSSNINNCRLATIDVLNSTLNKFGIQHLLGKYKAFIKADEKFIMHKVMDLVPKEHFIFSLTFSKKTDEKLKNKIFDLHSRGYMFAINDTSLDNNIIEVFIDVMECISFIKIDVNTPIDNFSLIDKFDLQTVITKVETNEMRNKADGMGCDYIQGYFFSEPIVLEQEKFNPDVKNVINICNQLMNDCSIDEIVSEFENNPAIAIQLLKFINSGTFNFKQKISSIEQVLNFVGRTKLTQWLMMMVYSGSSSQKETSSPLLEHVKRRTILMEEIAKLTDKNLASKAYFIGVISLMDTLFNTSIEIILKEMNVDKQTKEALLNKSNKLGEIYNLALAIENFDTKEIETYAIKNNISLEDLSKIGLKAL